MTEHEVDMTMYEGLGCLAELSAKPFGVVTAAVNRHDLLEKWVRAGLIRIKLFNADPENPYRGNKLVSIFASADNGLRMYRVVCGDVYVDEAAKDFPSEKLIATLALVLQARGELK